MLMEQLSPLHKRETRSTGVEVLAVRLFKVHFEVLYLEGAVSCELRTPSRELGEGARRRGIEVR